MFGIRTYGTRSAHQEEDMANPMTPQPASLLEIGQRDLSRRDVLKGMAAVAGTAGVATFLAACCSSGTATPQAAARATCTPAADTATPVASVAAGYVTLGSNHSDASEAKGMAAIDA